MFSDGSAFLKRAAVFQNELKRRRYPNAVRLAALTGCSKNTAQRTIDQLREDHLVPLQYDPTRRGYYLTEPLFQFPELPPNKDELTALLLMKDLAKIIAAADLHDALAALWETYEGKSGDGTKGLNQLAARFSSDLTAKAKAIEYPIIKLLQLADSGARCSLDYCSPWSGKSKHLFGRIMQLRYIDGMLYLIFETDRGKELILNLSFVEDCEMLTKQTEKAHRKAARDDSYGVWRDESVAEIELRILPPASHYYAAQVWHDSQQDIFDGEVLVRRLRSALSPEIVRRVLSLGGFLETIEPDQLKQLVLGEAKLLVKTLIKD